MSASSKASANPPRPPSLTELVFRHGKRGLSGIPAEAWVEWDKANAEFPGLRHDYYRDMAIENKRRWFAAGNKF